MLMQRLRFQFNNQRRLRLRSLLPIAIRLVGSVAVAVFVAVVGCCRLSSECEPPYRYCAALSWQSFAAESGAIAVARAKREAAYHDAQRDNALRLWPAHRSHRSHDRAFGIGQHNDGTQLLDQTTTDDGQINSATTTTITCRANGETERIGTVGALWCAIAGRFCNRLNMRACCPTAYIEQMKTTIRIALHVCGLLITARASGVCVCAFLCVAIQRVAMCLCVC